MPIYQRIEEWKVTERRDGAVYKTKLVRSWYHALGTPWPKDHGDVIWAATSDRNLYKTTEINSNDILPPQV